MRELQEGAARASRMAGAGGAPLSRPGRVLVVTTVAAVLMTMLGALGTGTAPLSTRLTYWLIVMEAGGLLGIGASTGIRSWGRLSGHPWAESALISVIVAAPLTLVVFGAMMVLFGAAAPTAGATATLFGYVLMLTCAVTAVNTGHAIAAHARAAILVTPDIAAPIAAAPAAVAPVAEPTRVALLDRLAPHLRNEDLHAIQAEDHYLRIYTTGGSELILLRLGDALREVGDIEGARTHRSWWVARGAIQSVRRLDGRAELTLSNGVIAPVSRSVMQDLSRRSWLG